jgi:hypothetical protein
MQDDAIEGRTLLRLQADTQDQSQQLADHTLESEIKRSEKKAEFERRQKEHEQQLVNIEHNQKVRSQQAEHSVKLDFQKRTNDEQIRFLASLRDMGVDVTKYLVAQYQHPDKTFRVETDKTSGAPPAVHLHQTNM